MKSSSTLGRALFASLLLHAVLLVAMVAQGALDSAVLESLGLGKPAPGPRLEAVLKRINSRPRLYPQRMARPDAERFEKMLPAAQPPAETALAPAEAAAASGTEGHEAADPVLIARDQPRPAQASAPGIQLRLPKSAEEPPRTEEPTQTEAGATETPRIASDTPGVEESAQAPSSVAAPAPRDEVAAMIELAALAREKAEARALAEARRIEAEEQRRAEEQARLARLMAEVGNAKPQEDLLAVPPMKAVDEVLARAEAEAEDRRAAAARAAALARQTEQTEQAELTQGRRGRIGRGYTADMALLDYGAGWRQQIERIGAMTFPRLAKDRVSETLLVTVSINSDGSLADIRVERSSGYQELDDAVRRVVESGTPFSAFPPSLKRRFDIVEITREWSFKEDRPRLDMDRLH